jgi:hypothetical protein
LLSRNPLSTQYYLLPSTAPQSPTSSERTITSRAMAHELTDALPPDERAAYFKKLSGNWGTLTLLAILKRCRLTAALDKHHQKAGERTLTGLGSRSENCYLYRRHLVIRGLADPAEYPRTVATINRHMETHHNNLPTDDAAEKEVLRRQAATYHGNRTESNDVTLIPTVMPARRLPARLIVEMRFLFRTPFRNHSSTVRTMGTPRICNP